ncbi:hypothetical protein, partial [Burkholderia pseudomallei]|uniref:hypothetical protein n=1 Tax=Burkholderia pseudomallei TaxID=28450 RepID=UPI001F451464
MWPKTDERPHREPAIARRTLVETSAPPRTADGRRPHLDHPASTLADAIIATNAPSHDHSSQRLHRS